MSAWWIAFWLLEAVLIGVVVVPKFVLRKDRPSGDAGDQIADEIGSMLFIGLAILIAVVAFTIFAWHHFRFAP